MKDLPQHLQKYIVEQDYQKYTARDHSLWRYILRQLKSFLSEHAHISYLEGLEKTGIEIDHIPKISDISFHLEKFGWRALPVSGFIPPAAFMELQSLNILPIASNMRSIDHLLYTPAPDIVHEAAGHAPFIADLEYADYLRQYAQVAKKAIISREDLEMYKAIRELSDIKENSASSETEIANAEKKLKQVSDSISYVSEASELSRMNWWTAEYGLVGDLSNPKIFGAGLLSSVGESQWCLSEKVKKISLTIDCIKQSYDITEPQPQLYVAKNFKHLKQVLNQLAVTMSFSIGGTTALSKAVKSESINTVEFENNLQISGVLKEFILDQKSKVAYLQFSGPTQICYKNLEVSGQGKQYHSHGYGTPVGIIKNFSINDLALEKIITLQYESGVRVTGRLSKISTPAAHVHILSFENAQCSYFDKILFLPEWGTYDIVMAETVTSVFGGPADRVSYGEVEDFVASRVSTPQYNKKQLELFEAYQQVRDLRNSKQIQSSAIETLTDSTIKNFSNEWLIFLELLEIAVIQNSEQNLINKIDQHLRALMKSHDNLLAQINSGLKLAYAKF